MNAIRTNSALRAATVTVAFFAWLVLSNHCALAEMLTAKTARIAAEESGGCHHNSAPQQHDEKPCPTMPQGCCKSLTVVVPDGTKVPTVSLESFTLPVEWMLVFTVALPEPLDATPVTGPPPDSPTFAELVLNRSLLSHAPPQFA